MRLVLAAAIFFMLAYLAMAEKAEENTAVNVYPYYGLNDPKLFLPTSTSTTTTTSTFTVTCTKSINAVASPCPTGRRRRRGIQLDDDNDEQFIVSPSAVQGVEATQVPSREARAADPQYFIVSPYGYYPQEIQSGFYNPLQYSPVALPYYGSYGQPMAGNRVFLTNLLPGVFATTTQTLTAFTVTTFTSTPDCAKAGTIPQCPNA